MLLRRLGWTLGFTKDVREELSELLYEIAVVSKDYEPENDQRTTGMLAGAAAGNPAAGLAIGILMSEDEEYNITFKSPKASFSFDDEELFSRFQRGDRVKVGYREVRKVTYDYVPPNFNEKKPIERTLAGYKFESAEKS